MSSAGIYFTSGDNLGSHCPGPDAHERALNLWSQKQRSTPLRCTDVGGEAVSRDATCAFTLVEPAGNRGTPPGAQMDASPSWLRRHVAVTSEDAANALV